MCEIEEGLYNAIFEDKRNVFMYGSGGTGKSYTIRKIEEECLKQDINISITATTGVSSVNVNGSTIYSWAGIGLGKDDVEILISKIKKNRMLCNRWQEAEILLIDEISMLPSEIFTKLNKIAKTIRKNETEFGGIQVIVVGDFLQLPPVKTKFCFQTNLWAKMKFVNFHFNTPYRYPCKKFYEMLMRIRVGEQTNDDIELLMNRKQAYLEMKDKMDKSDIKPTYLYSKKVDVDNINEVAMQKLNEPYVTYKCVDTIRNKKRRGGNGGENYNTILDNLSASTIALKKNAQVMITYNICVEEGICNGSRGRIVKCFEDSVEVELIDGRVTMIPKVEKTYENDEIYVSRKQIPLIIAYALTIHKTQGSTIDYCVINLGSGIFLAGQGYVALSRCKTIEGLFIEELFPEKIFADNDAYEFEKSFNKAL